MQEKSSKLEIQIFPGMNGEYVHFNKLFTLIYNEIPNQITLNNIDCKKVVKVLKEQYNSDIKDSFYRRNFTNVEKEHWENEEYYYLFDDTILFLNFEENDLKINFKKTDEVTIQEFINKVKSLKKEKEANKPELSLLVNTNYGIDTKSLEIKQSKIPIKENYNDDFLEVHQVILKRLQKKNDKGIVLLHGKPGTGKTSYIRHLIAKVKKNVIFLPTNMASALTNPELVSILIDNPNSILVVEDAENIVVDRENNGNSPVSALLNISDGLLSDCLNIQIICSFNTDISRIDSALLRKGRLIAKYEFKNLTVEKAQQLSDKLGYKTTISQPMNLSSIYNQTDLEFNTSATLADKIGF